MSERRPVIFEWFEYWSFNYWIHYESKIFGLVAVTLAAVNIFGGFVVTNRMLSMFKKKQ